MSKSFLCGSYRLSCLLLGLLLVGGLAGVFLSAGDSEEELQIEVLAESPIEVEPPTPTEAEDV